MEFWRARRCRFSCLQWFRSTRIWSDWRHSPGGFERLVAYKYRKRAENGVLGAKLRLFDGFLKAKAALEGYKLGWRQAARKGGARGCRCPRRQGFEHGTRPRGFPVPGCAL